jgi:hypothetical protein
VCLKKTWSHLGSPAVPTVRGLHCRGAACKFSKLSLYQVLEIRRLRAEGRKLVEIAHAFGLSKSGAWRVVNDRWKHIGQESVCATNSQV